MIGSKEDTAELEAALGRWVSSKPCRRMKEDMEAIVGPKVVFYWGSQLLYKSKADLIREGVKYANAEETWYICSFMVSGVELAVCFPGDKDWILACENSHRVESESSVEDMQVKSTA